MRKTIAEQLAEVYESILLSESSKPDYMDVDKDGNKKEPMKKAIKDATCECGCNPMSPKKGCTCKKKHSGTHGKHSMKEEGLKFKELYAKIIEGVS